MNSARQAARGGCNGDDPPRVNRSEASEHNGGGGVRDRWPDTTGCGGRWRCDRRCSSMMWAATATAARVCMVVARVCILALIPCKA